MPQRGRSSSPLLTPPVLIILLPIVAFVILFFAIPPFVTLTSQRLIRPNAVKKSWDWLNIFLVLFAILCGIFARKNDDESASGEDINGVSNAPNVPDNTNIGESVSVSQQWFGFSERNKIYDPVNSTPGGHGVRGLRRSSSSYPDLRQLDSSLETDRFQFRFFDDFEINKYRTPVFDHAHQPPRRSEAHEADVKVITVDTFVLRTPPKSPAPPPPPPPPPPAAQRKPRQTTYRTVGERNEKLSDVIDSQSKKVVSSPPTPPPPPPPRPPPPPSPVRIRSEHKYGKFERKKSNAKKEIAKDFLASIYNSRKRKKKQRTNIYETTTSSPPEHEPSYQSRMPPPSPPPPPPPLPPPPSSVFHSFFKKGISKSKKVHSVPVPPPPPPPYSRSSKHKSRSMAPPTPPPPPPAPSRRRTATPSGRPPLPTRSYDENANSGCQSPLIPMPPPPPPFKMPEMEFYARGDFVKIQSAHSSRCSSPELEDANPVSKEEETVKATNGGDGVGPVFCPSPDVNTKADTFIARLRDGWKLEKMNSLKEKQRVGHGPGPDSVMMG
ncbi:hypothetical protein FNV43_RR17921 [Rhamnella rubrinervis]|uniref:Uncharacterized protein n=1 Tax=Rhamnella rubrinervis TaxID=2594499 RepID=A0A8K0E2P4_9ROSA|nr:hypothetical protein FNV43_RR17921 [Rhamnella rubrinervis]